MLETGIKAPEFTLKNQDGEEVSLKDFLGKKVILYFYPKDNTPGCTTQACSFGDMYPQIREKGAVVLGVSKDSVASHKKFADKYGLPFTLLSDPELEVIQKYDVWQEKNMYGKKVMGVVRSTYLIDEEGIIKEAFAKVKPGENAETTAMREVEEEIGVSVERLRMTGTYWFGKKDMLMIGFIAEAKKRELVLSGEVDEAVWVPVSQALKMVHPAGSVSHTLVEYYLNEQKNRKD